jgi:hypothetical protein
MAASSSHMQNKKAQAEEAESASVDGGATLSSGDERDDVDTHASDLSSRTSKWRGSSSRSSGKKETQRLKMLAYLQKKG